MEEGHDDQVPIPTDHDPQDPLRPAGLATSTPIKNLEEAKSSLFCNTSSSCSPDSGLGGFKATLWDVEIDRLGTGNNTKLKSSKDLQIAPRENSAQRRSKGVQGERKVEGLGVPTMRKICKAQKRKRSGQIDGRKLGKQPINCEVAPGKVKALEVVNLENREISPVSERELSGAVRMGRTLSLPQVLRSVADVLEEGEIEDTHSSLGREAPGRSEGTAKVPPPAAKLWKKNGGKNVKGRATTQRREV